MLELVMVFNQISCNKGLKAKMLHFYMFLLSIPSPTPPAPSEAGMFYDQKDCFVPDIT